MPQSPSLGFELLTSNQDSKHVTVNASALILEAVSIGVVLDQLNTPPGAPTNGQLYLVGAAGTGAFLGQNNKLALYDSTTWYFYSPKTNQTLYNTALASYVRFGGSTWASVSLGGSSSPTTTKGDLIVRNNTTDVRQPIGTDGQVLVADSTFANGLKWAAPSGGTTSPTTTKGDLIVRDATVDVRQSVGTNGQILTADSAEVTGIKWVTPVTSGGAAGFSLLSKGGTTTQTAGTGVNISWDSVTNQGTGAVTAGSNLSTLTISNTGFYIIQGHHTVRSGTADAVGLSSITVASGTIGNTSGSFFTSHFLPAANVGIGCPVSFLINVTTAPMTFSFRFTSSATITYNLSESSRIFITKIG